MFWPAGTGLWTASSMSQHHPQLVKLNRGWPGNTPNKLVLSVHPLNRIYYWPSFRDSLVPSHRGPQQPARSHNENRTLQIPSGTQEMGATLSKIHKGNAQVQLINLETTLITLPNHATLADLYIILHFRSTAWGRGHMCPTSSIHGLDG